MLRSASPKPAMTRCSTHFNVDLVHISCPCTAKVTNTGSHWLVEHSRFHCHPTPSLARRSLDPQSLKQLENIVRIAPELSPLQLKMGMGRRENASSIDPTLQNLDRIRFEKKKIMKKSNYVTSKLSDIIRFQDECDNIILLLDQ